MLTMHWELDPGIYSDTRLRMTVPRVEWRRAHFPTPGYLVMAGVTRLGVNSPIARWMRRNRKSCLRADVICICACLSLFIYLGYSASQQRDTRDVQMSMDPGPLQDLCETSEKWILVNISADDQSDLSSIQDIRDWRILVLDLHQQRPVIIRRCVRCIFISNPRNLNTGWNTANDLDPAFLPLIYAIKRGAKWIYVTKDPKQLHRQIRHFRLERSSGLVAESVRWFYPSQHFTATQFKHKAGMYKVSNWPQPSLQTRWRPGSKYVMATHACLALPVLIPPGVIGLTDLSYTVYGYESFWSLASVASSANSLVWSLWKQRLLWEIRGTTAIFQPGECDKLTSADLEDEADLDESSQTDLLDFFQKWKCKDGGSFFSCVQLLTRDMRKENFFTSIDVHSVNTWIEYLTEYNYREPVLRKTSVNITGHNAVYNVASSLKDHISELQNPFIAMCKNYTKTSLQFTVKASLQDVALIVNFNSWVPYDIIVFLNYLYSRYFSNIIYCGEKLPNLLTVYKTYKEPINFIQIDTKHGEIAYKCIAAVIKMGLKVKGYLQMSDDVMANFKQLAKLPKDKPWFQNNIRVGNITANKVRNVTPLDPDKRAFWWPWGGDGGVSRLRVIWQKLKRTLTEKPVLEFLQMIKRNSGKEDRAFYETSNIFYIPFRLKDKFLYFANLFSSNNVYRDIAVPTILNGMTHKEDIVHMNGSYLWFRQRKEYRKHYRTNHHYLHPWILPRRKDSVTDLKFLCDIYLPRNI